MEKEREKGKEEIKSTRKARIWIEREKKIEVLLDIKTIKWRQVDNERK